jgi:hypothetical protein
MDPGITVTNAGDSNLVSSAQIAITNNYQSGDTLNATSLTGGITESYSAGTLTLTGSGTTTASEFQTALQSVTFSSSSASTATRTLSVTADDGAAVSTPATETIDVQGSTSPTVTPSGTPANYTAGSAAVTVDSGITVTNAGDSGKVSSAKVVISTGFTTGDTLSATSLPGGITQSYSSGTLTLTGSGTTTATQFTTALASVKFSNATSTSTATRTLTVTADDGSSVSNNASETINVFAPAEVTAAYIKGSAWTSTFTTYLGSHSLGNASTPTLGYALKTGSAQTTVLPWSNLNTIDLTFNEPLSSLSASSLILSGGTGSGIAAPPTVTGFSALGGNTYQWTLSGPLTNNKYEISLLSNSVTDSRGAALDGKWVTGTSTFPSGTGLAGSGNFDFYFNVLPGNAQQNGTVSGTSSNLVKSVLNDRSTTAGYDPYYDITGGGTISGTDANLVKANLNARNSNASSPPALTTAGGSGAGADLTSLALGVQESNAATDSAVANFDLSDLWV